MTKSQIETPASIAVLTNVVEDKVETAKTNVVEDRIVTSETNTEATETRVLATPLASKAEEAPDKEAKHPSHTPVAQAALASVEEELPNTVTSKETLYLILSLVFVTARDSYLLKLKNKSFNEQEGN